MGNGVWTTHAYTTSMATRGIDANNLNANNVNEFYKAFQISKDMNPYGVKTRDCRDSDEHPNTIPVILALDVTGSMGSACAAVARQLDKIMTSLYEKVTDVEFMVMGIGDLSYDKAPIQISQFESDIRILDQLGHIYFERGGGGNGFESYTAAWYMGARHTDLDCWKRGKKGIIITMGDEPLNPYLPKYPLYRCTGDNVQDDIDTSELYVEVSEKYDIYHIVITDEEASSGHYMSRIEKTFGKYLDGQHLLKSNSEKLPQIITDIVSNRDDEIETKFYAESYNVDNDGIGW